MSGDDALGLGTGALARLADDIAVQDYPEPAYRNVLWWHRHSHADEAPHWAAAGLGAHDITGTVAGGDLNVSPSILCRGCGRHGFITTMTWRDA